MTQRMSKQSMDDTRRRIRERAYTLWETQGRPHGRDQEHWLQAEAEITAAGTRVRSTRAARRGAR